MVPLPLFKLGALFLRYVSKYGANRIKAQAHNHPSFGKFAARYGQAMHQLQMRISVTLLRRDAEARAREKADRVERAEKAEKAEDVSKGSLIITDPAAAAKPDGKVPALLVPPSSSSLSSASASPTSTPTPPPAAPLPSVWRRQFRPLPEAKAIDLFADAAGDALILVIASLLILYEYSRSAQRPDQNLQRIRKLQQRVEELEEADALRADIEAVQLQRLGEIESVLGRLRQLPQLDAKT